jgi:hypothetical protein
VNAYRLQLGQRVLVNTRTGDAILGNVSDVNRGAVALSDASLISRDGRGPLDGIAIIPADNVAWIQVQ